MKFFAKYVTILFALFALWQPATAQRATETTSIDYAYGNGNDDLAIWGTGKKETYDVAIRVNNPALVGTTIKGVTLYIPQTPAVKDLKVWMTKELTLNAQKQNVADIITQDVDTAKAFNEEYISFEHPYTLTSEGVYVGYSFTVTAVGTDQNAANPVLVCYKKEPGGFYIHSSKKYLKWIDNSSIANLVLQVRVEGVAANGAKVEAPAVAYVVTGKEATANVDIVNYGANGVQSVDLSYSVEGKNYTQHCDLPTEAQIAGEFGKTAQVAVKLPAFATDGVYPTTMRVDKVNGKENALADAVQKFSVDARAYVPVHRAVVEEFTGTWCGNCPRGFAAMKAMKRLHAEQFVGLAYHNKDSMMVMDGENFPINITGFPSATIERGEVIDPYFGSDKTGTRPFYFEKEWNAVVAQPALMDVAVAAKLSADGKKVRAEARITSPRAVSDADYKVELVLVGNGMKGTGSGWIQTNDIVSATSDEFPEPEFAPFLGTSSSISGLEYDDVVLATTRLMGNDIEIPAAMEAYKAYSAEAEFDLAKVVTSDKNNPIKVNKKKLDVAALLINRTTGKVANAAIAAVDVTDYLTGVAQVTTTKAPTTTSYYDLSGRRVSATAKGVFVTNTGRKIVR